ncbi:TIGR02186 family protein [Gemmobacter fulvus]|uniref:TIGR02186 family protein n=1 Tax=Gemmobacter fulvus TaxID=2840474 RepID=A0A975S263_9RHOB|nr:TIGR02186 family protein [Gemmobacter fulvus]MBT9244137.1 TIGR02186 family protein [Gemmobacter fulvus]MDQ1849348.1 TIGR02186 family protein [Gemmobacter fulvus]QWK91041.1 TIGR02186 family protein [Gemmobacter fulvus]
MRGVAAIALVISGLLTAPPAFAAAEKIVAGLSQSSVSITADFDGSEILIYGAVKRDAPIPSGPPLRVIITVQGPDTALTVWRKDRRFGIWLNNAAVLIDRAPSFYAVASSGVMAESLTETEDLRHRITLPRAIRAVGIAAEADGAPLFVEALRRVRETEGRYSLREGSVSLTQETLFRADVALPAALTEGDYKVRIFLTREGQVIDALERRIWVRKAGLERFFYQSAHEQPLLYGLASLVLAALAGWGASVIFARVRW